MQRVSNVGTASTQAGKKAGGVRQHSLPRVDHGTGLQSESLYRFRCRTAGGYGLGP